MSFKSNLLKKIEIKELSAAVINSIGAPDSGLKIDRKAMARLLDMMDFEIQMVRDLKLYVRSTDGDKQEILVFDNELAFYKTTVSDVVLRKSPTLKEMISIRNAIKILNDKDVVLTKRVDTVSRIKNELLDSLNLSYTDADVESIVEDGVASLKNSYSEGVTECLILLAEILEYQNPPNSLKVKHYLILGNLQKDNAGRHLFGPMVVYSQIHNTLRWIDRQIDFSNKRQLAEFKEDITFDKSFDKMDEEVLVHLESIIKLNANASKTAK